MLARIRRHLAHRAKSCRSGTRRAKGRDAGDEFVEEDAELVDVGESRGRPAAELLVREVLRTSENDADLREVGISDGVADVVVSSYAFHHLDDGGKELAIDWSTIDEWCLALWQSAGRSSGAFSRTRKAVLALPSSSFGALRETLLQAG